MKVYILMIIGIIGLIGIAVAQLDISHDLSDNEHYFIVGHVYEPYTHDNSVILVNTRTNEFLQVTAIDCDGLKEYLFNLANLHQGWNPDDTFIINYGNETIQFNLLEESVAAQVDINRPDDVDPILILTGFIVIASGGVYYYFRKKKKPEVTTMEETKPEPVQTRSYIDKVFGGTKKAWIILMTLGLLGLYYTQESVPYELLLIYITIVSTYFGAGSVKLGIDSKK